MNHNQINQIEINERFEITSPKDLWTVIIILKGNGNYQFQAHIQEFRYCDCLLIAPEEKLALVPEYRTSCSIISLTLSKDYMISYKADHSSLSMLEGFLDPNSPLITFTLESNIITTIQNYANLLYDIQDCDLPYSVLIHQHIISAFILYLSRTYHILKPSKKQASKELSSRLLIIEKVKHYINLNYSEDLSLSGIADYVFINPSYLSRIFKEATGVGLFTYINQIRISKARQLLVDTEDLIIDIAVACGFNYIPHFNNVFKGLESMTPSQYRKKNKHKQSY